MKKVVLLFFALVLAVLTPISISAQCPGATRTVTNSKSSIPNDAIGAVLKNFFQDGGSATWRFEPGATFVENTDGTANLKGVLAYYDKPSRRFQVDITFIGQTYTPPPGSPVQMNVPGPSTGWYYYQWGPTSMLTGLDDLAGAKLNLSLRGKAFQVGISASDQVPDAGKFGATGWFSYSIVSQPTNPAIRINSFPANPAVDQADIAILLSGTPTDCGSNPCASVISATASATSNVKCNGGNDGAASVSNVSGGTSPYTYKWSTGATTTSISSLTAGTYTVTITDSKGCSITKSVTITEPTKLSASASANPTSCGATNGSVSATATGGTAPYTYAWSNGATTASITGLSAGTYSVTVKDANGCTAAAASATVTSSTNLSVDISSVNASCNGGNNGSATASATGGSGTYTYKWSNNATTAAISNLTAGTYTVTVSDASGCSGTKSVTITEPAKLTVSISTTPVSCSAKGTATATAAGGNGGYTFSWSPSGSGATISNLNSGTVKVTVTDSKGCTGTAEATVQSSVSNISCSVAVTKLVSAVGQKDAEAKVTVSGGIAPYTYKWSDNQTTETAVNLGPGSYSVTVTDKNGCSTTCSVTVAASLCDQIVDPGTIQGEEEFCPGGALKAITEKTPATGGSGAIEYLWMYSGNPVFDRNSWLIVPGATGKDLPSELIPQVSTTTYFIRCVRRKGCTDYQESNAVAKKVLAYAQISGPFEACLNTSATFKSDDLGAGATYYWSFTNSTPSNSSAREVTVKFTSPGKQKVQLEVSRNGCYRTQTYFIDVKSCFTGSGAIESFSLLPVNGSRVKVNWTTVGEMAKSSYIVERSADGQNFEEVATLKSQNNTKNAYSFEDHSMKMGRSFYRIKHIEADGNITYSLVEKTVLYINGGQPVMIYPNPASSKMFVEVLDTDNTEGTIDVFNTMGKLVYSKRFTKEQIRYEVELNDVPNGTYILRVRQNDGQVRSLKFNKF